MIPCIPICMYTLRYVSEGVVLPRCNSQTLCWSALNLPNNELYNDTFFHYNIKTFNIQIHSNITASSFWARYYKKDLKILHRASPPSCLPSCLPDIMHGIFSPKPSPSIFAYCKWSKTGGGNSLGTQLWVWCQYSSWPHSQACVRAWGWGQLLHRISNHGLRNPWTEIMIWGAQWLKP